MSRLARSWMETTTALSGIQTTPGAPLAEPEQLQLLAGFEISPQYGWLSGLRSERKHIRPCSTSGQLCKRTEIKIKCQEY